MHRTRAWYLLVLTLGFNGGNPLQCSCLENPRDGGAWWAAISGVAQSQTQLKRLSSSSRTILSKFQKQNESVVVATLCQKQDLTSNQLLIED